jgi:ankyrin repeat protein
VTPLPLTAIAGHFGHTPLATAAGSGDDSVMRILLETDANIDAQGNIGEADLLDGIIHGQWNSSVVIA